MAITRFKLDQALRQTLSSGVTLLTPNYRLAASVLEAYGSSSPTVSWREPTVVPVDIWVAQIWEMLSTRGLRPFVDWDILEPSLEREIWLEAIEETRNDHPLIDTSAMARIAARAFQDLRRASADSDVHWLRDFDYLPDVALFNLWQQHFSRRCESLGRITLVEAITLLALNLDSTSAKLIGNIATLNFYETPENYGALFNSLSKFGKLQAFFTLDKTKFTETPAVLLNERNVAAYRTEFKDQASEIQAAASWALTLQKQDPTAHIGIITPTPARVQPDLERALRRIKDEHAPLRVFEKPHLINSSSTGTTLAKTAIVKDALIILGLNREKQSLVDFCRLLRSPFIIGADEESEERIKCERILRRHLQTITTRNAITRFTGAKDKDYACPLLHNAMLEARTFARSRHSIGVNANTRIWATLFREQLALLGWPGEKNRLLEKASLNAWEEVLSLFEQNSELGREFSLEAALNALKRLIDDHRSQNVYRQQCSLSLYSPAEAVGMNFTHLWLLSFDDQSWPQAAHPNPLIPHPLQRELNIPGSTAALQYSAARSDLAVLCANVSETLVASYFSQGDDSQLRMSNLLASLPQIEIKQLPYLSTNDSLMRTNHECMEQILDQRRVQVSPAEKIKGGQALITSQSQCPFQAFIKRRLNTETLEPFKNGLDHRERGQAIHLALESLYTHIPDKAALIALLEPPRSLLDYRLDEAVSVAINALKKLAPEFMGPAFSAIESARIRRILSRFLLRDSQRGDFKSSSQEKHFTLALEGFDLSLKIDRIDELNDGSYALIDYKTGGTIKAISSLQSARPEEMQLPVYSTAVTRESQLDISALAIAQVNVKSIDYKALARGANFDPNIAPLTGAKSTAKDKISVRDAEADAAEWTQKTQRWATLVDELAAEFVSGECRVAPIKSPSVCEYCRLQSVCRISELRSDDGFSSDDDDGVEP